MSADPGTTITCQEVVELVTDYLEGALDDETRVEVEAHLALCPGCDEFLRQMRATLDAVGHVPLDTLSEAARDELLTAFRRSPPTDG